MKQKVEKLLGPDHGISIVGDAKKYVVDVARLSHIHQPAGFPRPVYIARPHYSDVLERLGNVATVVGDIYELDLALPDVQGKEILLLRTRRTPRWEIPYIVGHPRAAALPSLGDIIARLDR